MLSQIFSKNSDKKAVTEFDYEANPDKNHAVGTIVNIQPTILKSKWIGNLPRSSSSFYRVTQPFNVQVKITNHFTASKFIGSTYKVIQTKKGDEIHSVALGLFLVSGKNVYKIRPRTFPFERLKQIQESEKTQVLYNRKFR